MDHIGHARHLRDKLAQHRDDLRRDGPRFQTGSCGAGAPDGELLHRRGVDAGPGRHRSRSLGLQARFGDWHLRGFRGRSTVRSGPVLLGGRGSEVRRRGGHGAVLRAGPGATDPVPPRRELRARSGDVQLRLQRWRVLRLLLLGIARGPGGLEAQSPG